MSNYSKSSRRRSGRGPRRGQDRQDRPGRHEDQRRPIAPAAPAKAPSLWQKIISIFTGGKPAATRQASPAKTYVPRSASSGSNTGGARENRERSYTPGGSSPRPARKPEAVEVTSAKLYVGNLSFDATESDLFELFKGTGAVRNAEIVSHKHNDKSKGFGFVTMATVEEAKRAVEVLHDQEFMGRKLVVSGAKTPVERDSDREPAPSAPAESTAPEA